MELGKIQIPKIELETYKFIHDYQTRLFVQYADIVEKTDIGRSVVQSLSEDPRVLALEGKMISQGSHAERFETKNLAMWFLWCANEYGLEAAKSYLESFLDAEEVDVVCTLWVLGIEVDQPITINDRYIIKPIEDMPNSRDKEHFLKFDVGVTGPRAPRPKCAITVSCRVKKAIDADAVPSTDSNEEFWEENHRLYDIAMLLNALEGVTCLPYYSTSYVDGTIPPGPLGGSGGSSPIYDVTDAGLTRITNDSQTLINELFKKLLSLDKAGRERIQHILFRLSQAKRRNQIEDKILDLGITLEMLLLEDNPNNEQLALSFRLRGSWLLGTSVEDRIEKYKQLKEIYTYRSQVAHSGVLCKGKVAKIEEVRQAFPDYQSLAENICQRIIKDGKPNWDDLVLGAT